jgi:hypothetical protein
VPSLFQFSDRLISRISILAAQLSGRVVLQGPFDYAPGAAVHASPIVEAAPSPYTEYVPYIGYDLTPYYNLAPGCPLSNFSPDLAHIC